MVSVEEEFCLSVQSSADLVCCSVQYSVYFPPCKVNTGTSSMESMSWVFFELNHLWEFVSGSAVLTACPDEVCDSVPRQGTAVCRYLFRLDSLGSDLCLCIGFLP